MKHIVKREWLILILLGILWGVGIFYGCQAEQRGNQVSIRIKAKSEDTFTVKELTALYESEKAYKILGVPEITGFGDMGRTKVFDPVTGRNMITDYMLVWGDKSLVYQGALLDGSYGLWDSDECVITSKAAKELFQSENVVGLVLVWNHKEWVIRGVTDSSRPVILFTAGEGDCVSNLEFIFPKGSAAGLETENMLSRNNLEKETVMIDYRLYGAICRLCYLLPCFYLLWLGLARINIKPIKKGIIFTLLCFLLISQMFRFPVTYIPSKWSDFDFWTAKWKGIILNAREIRELIPLSQDIVFMRNVMISIAASLAAGIGIVIYVILVHRACRKSDSSFRSSQTSKSQK